VKVAKILGVVFGALFLLTGIGLLAGAAVFNTGGSEFDRRLAEQGLAGPVEGRVTGISGPIYTVEYTDRQGATTTGRGTVAEGTTPPAQGDDVEIYYSTADPSQIIILDFPGGNFVGVAGLLRTIAIVCVVIGAVLLLAGLLGLLTGRKRASAVASPPAGYAPPAAMQAAQEGPTQAPPPDAGQAQSPQPSPTPTDPPASDPGGPPDQPPGPGTRPDPPLAEGSNRPGG
jgi:hypothetical protein